MQNIVRSVAIILAIASCAAQASPRARSGDPVPYAAASKIIRLAEQGNVVAQGQLGFLYQTGRGVPQDAYEAAKWYYRAANQGNGRAQYELGLLYNKGQGVPRDLLMAYMWLNLSASQAMGDERDFRSRIRDAVAQKMTMAQIAAAQALAREWYKSR